MLELAGMYFPEGEPLSNPGSWIGAWFLSCAGLLFCIVNPIWTVDPSALEVHKLHLSVKC